MIRCFLRPIACCLVAAALLAGDPVGAQPSPGPPPAEYRILLDQYCVSCHNQALVEGTDEPRTALISQLRAVGLSLDTLDLATVGADAPEWEQVVRKLRAGLMPPAGRPRPDDATYDAFKAWLETQLDDAWAARPNPGRRSSAGPPEPRGRQTLQRPRCGEGGQFPPYPWGRKQAGACRSDVSDRSSSTPPRDT